MNSNNVLRFLVIAICLLTPTASFSGELSLPKGWRLPTTSEITPNQEWRSNSPTRYLTVNADFNGDGVVDTGMLLVSKNGFELALFVFLSQKDGSSKIYLLDKLKHIEHIQVMGIELAVPNKYKTACGKGYFDCQPGELEEITLKNPAIDYFKIESANSFFYWEESKKIFKRIWMSD